MTKKNIRVSESTKERFDSLHYTYQADNGRTTQDKFINLLLDTYNNKQSQTDNIAKSKVDFKHDITEFKSIGKPLIIPDPRDVRKKEGQ